jgi:hypothetical protein
MARLLPIYDAARAMGISPVTLRKRLKAGTARGEQQKTQQGYQWLVHVEDADLQSAPAPDTSPPGTPPESTQGTTPETAQGVPQETTQGEPAADTRGLPGDYPAAGEVIARLEAHLADVRAHTARLEEELSARRRELDEERDAHHRQVQALMALLGQSQQLQLAPPAEDTNGVAVHAVSGGSDPTTPQTQNGATAEEPERRRWWQRLLFG